MDKEERQRLVSLIRESAAPLMPEPPELPAKLASLMRGHAEKFRAVLFDVYGTLFCSAAGDISLADSSTCIAHNTALEIQARQFGLRGEALRVFFRNKAAEIHKSRSAQTKWSEVQVEKIWAGFLAGQNSQCYISRFSSPETAAREFALRYELAVNPVCPMPGAAETIAALKKSGCVLGIISNAQFFTPLLFEAFFGGPPEQLGFEPPLIIWSFEMGEAKPSQRLFEKAARGLAVLGIAAGDCAFVGNDMFSDIYGSTQTGFKGILFAGDKRSLRLRTEEPLARDLLPRRIIRELKELIPEDFIQKRR